MFLTVEDMVATFGEEEMLQLAGTGPRDYRSLDRAKVEEAIDHAERTVRGYVIDRWPNAFPSGTPLLRGFAADLARHRLRGRGGQQNAMNDTVQKRYDTAIARLKDLSQGRMTLDLPAGTAGAEAASNEMRILAEMPAQRAGSILQGYSG